MIGSHLSIAGGMHNALISAHDMGFDTVQVFTKNQQQWRFKPLEPQAIAQWLETRHRLGFDVTVSHDSYLINLASPQQELWEKSVELFAEELRRCAWLEIPFLVTHPGAHMGEGEQAGLQRVVQGIDQAYARSSAKGVTTCLEITAGQGTSLGYKLEHLAEIICLSHDEKRLGVCLDTAHLFAAGYDFRGRYYDTFVHQLERTVGAGRVKVLHLNDSKKPLNSRVDRHEHLGDGTIGLNAFAPFVRDERWRGVPKILETPKLEHPSGRPWDEINLERLRALTDEKVDLPHRS